MKTTLNIKGMSCQHCVKAVTAALKGIPGVKSAKVDLKKNTAVVDYKEGVTDEALKAAVTEAGYETA
jgi:copper ion binding protein